MKKALYLSVALNFFVVLFFVGKRFYYSSGSKEQVKLPNYFDLWDQMRFSMYSELPVDSSDVLFFGNSLTEAFPVSEVFGPHCKNRGIGGNQTSHILNRIGASVKFRPGKVFIEGGVNDLNNGLTADSVAKNYALIIDKVKAISPGTRIYIFSIFPTSMQYDRLNGAIKEVNSRVSNTCKEKKVQYINVHDSMVRDGRLDSSLTGDGIHLNNKGYGVWAKAISPYL